MSRLLDRIGRDEDGFTLIELLVAMVLGMIVVIGILNLLDSGARSATRTVDRADVTQRGRTAMNEITQGLRSQVCPDDQTPPVVSADGSSVTFYSDTGGSDAFTPQAVRIWLDTTWQGGRGAIMQWTYPGTDLSATTDIRKKVLITDVAASSGTPFLTYYAFDSATALSTPLSATITGDTLPINSIAKVLRVDVSYRVAPSASLNGSSRPLTGKQLDALRDSDFKAQVWVRNSDYTDQSVTDNNRKWGPRCD